MSKKYLLDDEENDLLKPIESGEWESIDNLKGNILEHKNVAKNTLKKING